MLNTEEAEWEDDGRPPPSHRGLNSEAAVDSAETRV